METTNKRRENLTWPDEDETRKQLEAIRELAKELRTDYPTDTPQIWGCVRNQQLNRRNAYIRAQFSTDETAWHLINGSEWLELFDLLGFSVDKETRKRFASHLNWYSFWYANFKPRLSSKYAQRIHWYVCNFLFCLRNKLQTEKDYREGKYGSKGQAYFMKIEEQPATPAETPRIVRVEIVRDFDSTYYANLYVGNGGCHNLSKEYTDFRTLKTLCKKEYGVNLPNLSQIEFEKHGRKSYAYISSEAPRISTETAETVNVSKENENAAGTKEMPRYEYPNYADYAFERGWSIENTDFDAHSGVLCMIHFDPTDEKYVCGCLWQINSDSPNYTEHRRFKTLKGAQNYGTKRMGMKLKYQTLTVHCPIAPTEPPQSPGTPQTVECTTDTPEPRETARKRQNRTTGSAQATRRDTLRDTLRPVTYVPRECSTADAAYR